MERSPACDFEPEHQIETSVDPPAPLWRRVLELFPIACVMILQIAYLFLFPGCVLSNLIILADILCFLIFTFMPDRTKLDVNAWLEELCGNGVVPKREPPCLLRLTHETRTLQKMFAILQEIQSIEAKRLKYDNSKLLAPQVWVTKRALRCGNIVLTAKEDNHAFAAIVTFLRHCHLSANFFDWTQFDEDCSKRERKERAKQRRDTLKAPVVERQAKETAAMRPRTSRRRKTKPITDKENWNESTCSGSKLSFDVESQHECESQIEPCETLQYQEEVDDQPEWPNQQQEESTQLADQTQGDHLGQGTEVGLPEVLQDLDLLDIEELFPEDQFDEDDGWDTVSGEYSAYMRVRNELERSSQSRSKN
eukprot:c10974_g1_i2.p1 GENE.c10974_g1_i2~~c10974_g1_i2.p1  ORF type:complete len:365 (+),score=78.21 c10974_g1_i2:28-1122(+)